MISPTIFLSTALSGSEKRRELKTVLERAGLTVIPSDNDLQHAGPAQLANLLYNADCSVHIIDNAENKVPDDEQVRSALQQFQQAVSVNRDRPEFKIIVWQEGKMNIETLSSRQIGLINEIRNNISNNMIFTDVNSAIRLVDDIRSFLDEKKQVLFDVHQTQVFFIANQLDEGEANEIIDMLTDVVEVEKLCIVQDSPMDYSEFCKQQMEVSKMAVIYFKYSTDWAIPFMQEIWKRVGGASAHTPMLLIGDETPDTNRAVKFSAPRVSYMLVAGELIPLEIKVMYDKAAGIN